MLKVKGKLISISRKPKKAISELPIIIAESKKDQAFGGNNPCRIPYLFTPLESKAVELFNGFIEDRKVYHEFNLKVKDEQGKIHNYYADLYDAITKTCIEVSPAFHKKYEIVIKSDKRRARLLKKRLNIETIHIKGNDLEEINQVIQYLEKKGISKEILDFYLSESNGKRGDKQK